MNSLFKSSYRNIFFLGLLVFLITSIFSIGYYHPDEHFQILEFANYKLGNSPASDLPWEFQDRIRPTLLPSLGILLIKVINLLGIENPFTYTLIFRIITALLSWLVIIKLSLVLISDFGSKNGKKIFLLLNLFLWFIPFLSVRFSSENYSAITFLATIYFILQFNSEQLKKNSLRLVIAGLLMGFSFFFRFQIGFAIIGFTLWLILINKMNLKNISILMVSGFTAVVFCIYLDFWFYGKFEITPVNYFIANIIEHKAANWGTSPWWGYFQMFSLSAIPPISVFLLLFFIYGIYNKPKSIFTWSIIPFLIAHFVVAHKELRFLFPMIFCFLYLTAIGVDNFLLSIKIKKWQLYIFNFFASLNILILCFFMFIPAQSVISCYKFLYDFSSNEEQVLICRDSSIYELVGIKVNFYKPKTIKTIVMKDDFEVADYLKETNPNSVLLLERNFTANKLFTGYNNKTIYFALPRWIINFNFNNWISRARIWKIQELRKDK